MPREYFEPPVITELSVEAVNVAMQTMGQHFESISLALAKLEGLDGNVPKLANDLDLDGKDLKNVKNLKFNTPTKAGRKLSTEKLTGTGNSISNPATVPATATILRDDLVANTLPAIQTALNKLGQSVATLLDILKERNLV